MRGPRTVSEFRQARSAIPGARRQSDMEMRPSTALLCCAQRHREDRVRFGRLHVMRDFKQFNEIVHQVEHIRSRGAARRREERVQAIARKERAVARKAARRQRKRDKAEAKARARRARLEHKQQLVALRHQADLSAAEREALFRSEQFVAFETRLAAKELKLMVAEDTISTRAARAWIAAQNAAAAAVHGAFACKVVAMAACASADQAQQDRQLEWAANRARRAAEAESKQQQDEQASREKNTLWLNAVVERSQRAREERDRAAEAQRESKAQLVEERWRAWLRLKECSVQEAEFEAKDDVIWARMNGEARLKARLLEEQRARLAEEARQKKLQIERELKRREEENERRKMRRKSAQERLAAEKAAKRAAALEAKRAAEEAHFAEQARLKRELSLCLCPHCNPDQCDSVADLAKAKAKGAARHAAEAAASAAEAAMVAMVVAEEASIRAEEEDKVRKAEEERERIRLAAELERKQADDREFLKQQLLARDHERREKRRIIREEEAEAARKKRVEAAKAREKDWIDTKDEAQLKAQASVVDSELRKGRQESRAKQHGYNARSSTYVYPNGAVLKGLGAKELETVSHRSHWTPATQ